MKKLFLLLIIGLLSLPLYSQEDTENCKYSIGFTSSNWGNDYGMFFQTNKDKHGFSIAALKSNRIYGVGLDVFSEYQLEAGKTEGYDIGGYYHYSVKKKTYMNHH